MDRLPGDAHLATSGGMMRAGLPTDAELREICSRKWAVSGPFNIDQWPVEILALSIPTTFIPVTDFDEFWQIWEGDTSVMRRRLYILQTRVPLI